jgi:hypothetical protein
LVETLVGLADFAGGIETDLVVWVCDREKRKKRLD